MINLPRTTSPSREEARLGPDARAQSRSGRRPARVAFRPALETMESRVCLASGSTLTTIGAGADYTLKLNSTGRVAVAQISPAEFERWGNTTANAADFQAMTRRIYGALPDKYDFLFFVNNEQSVRPGADYYGLNYTAKNDVTGLGQGTFDRTGEYGSAGKLRSVIHLTSRGGLRGGPSLHEILHAWGNYLPEIDGGSPSHWGFSSVGGQLGGWEPGTLKDLGGGNYDADGPGGDAGFGTFANGGNSIPYSQLELYLMGLIGPDQVTTPIQVARDASLIDDSRGTFHASRIDTYSIQDIIAREGARSPSVSDSPKSFRALTVVLTPTALNQADLNRYDDDVEAFGLPGADQSSLDNFWEATGGRATIQMSDTPQGPDGGFPPPPSDTSAPTVKSVRKLANRRGVSAIVLEFSEPLDPSKAGTLLNYSFSMRGRDRKFGTRDDRTVKFARVALSADLTTVTLTLKRPLVVTEPVRLLARGSALADQAGNLLDGNGDGVRGDDYLVLITRKR